MTDMGGCGIRRAKAFPSNKEQQAVKLLKELGYKIEKPLPPIQPEKMVCSNGINVEVNTKQVLFSEDGEDYLSISFEDFEQVNNLWEHIHEQVMEREEIEE